MKKLLILITTLAIITTTSCGKKMDEAKTFIEQVHLEMVKRNYEYIYDNLMGEEITITNSKEEIVDLFSQFLDDADITEVRKSLGYSIKINNGFTKVESKYLWKGKNYDVRETIIVWNNKKGFKLEGIKLKKVE